MDIKDLESCREKALRLLEQRGHSTAELRRKLYQTRKFTAHDIASVLEDLQKAGLLNDELFATDCVAFLKNLPMGRRLAENKLRSRGLSADLIAKALDEHWEDEEANEQQRAHAAAMTKWRLLQHSQEPVEKKLQKLARTLASKGFPMEVIYRELELFRKG